MKFGFMTATEIKLSVMSKKSTTLEKVISITVETSSLIITNEHIYYQFYFHLEI